MSFYLFKSGSNELRQEKIGLEPDNPHTMVKLNTHTLASKIFLL